jgi:hypothetical protein
MEKKLTTNKQYTIVILLCMLAISVMIVFSGCRVSTQSKIDRKIDSLNIEFDKAIEMHGIQDSLCRLACDKSDSKKAGLHIDSMRYYYHKAYAINNNIICLQYVK